MKIGLMQPYFMPYIGYFQLINAVELYVIHDDVQYIKNGWINRNKILMNRTPIWLTLPVKKDSAELKINQRKFTDNVLAAKEKILRQIYSAYSKAPYFKNTNSLLEQIIYTDEKNVSLFIVNSIKKICEFIRINTEIKISSQLEKNDDRASEARVLEICKVCGASEYINPIGGTGLYDKNTFLTEGVVLKFIKTDSALEPFMSVIDVMMNHSIDDIHCLLDKYAII